MASNSLYVQCQPTTLAGSGAVAGATSVILASFYQIDGLTALTMANFGSKGYGTLEPNNGTQEEQISFTGITSNVNGTFTLTGVAHVMFVSPYTETSGLGTSHPGGAIFVISNNPGLYNHFVNKDDNGTVDEVLTFSHTNRPTIDLDTDTVNATDLVTLGQMSRQAISGAANMSLTVKGIAQAPSQSAVDNKVAAGSTAALLAVTPDKLRATKYNDYVVDTGTSTAYAIAPTPVITQYVAGLEFRFKASHTNGAAPTISVNGLAAKALNFGKVAIGLRSITTNTMVGVQYDGSAMQVIDVSRPMVSQEGGEIYGTSVGVGTAYAVALTPALTAYTAGLVVRFKPDTASSGGATLNVNSLGAKTIKRNGVSLLANSDIPANQVAEVVYDDAGEFELKGTQAIVGKIKINKTSIQSINSTSENVICTAWIPGLTLGTDGAVRVTISCSAFGISNTKTCTLRLKYGSTTVASTVYTATGGILTASAAGRIEALLIANGSTSSQIGSLFSTFGDKTNATSAVQFAMNDAIGTASENSNNKLALVVTAQFNNSNGADTITANHSIIEFIT